MEFYQFKDLLGIMIMAAVVLIPVVGLTARFTLGPLIDKFSKARAGQVDAMSREIGDLRQDVDTLRERLDRHETQVERIEDVVSFERRLKG